MVLVQSNVVVRCAYMRHAPVGPVAGHRFVSVTVGGLGARAPTRPASAEASEVTLAKT